MASLFDNKLFLQYLSGAGASIAAGKGPAEGLNAVTQQAIKTQNYSKVLQKMLSGEIPDEGSITFKNGEATFKVPAPAKPQGDVADALGGYSPPETTPQVPQVPQVPNVGIGGVGNFLANASPSDLAGLTPEDISSALRLQFAQQELGLRQQSLDQSAVGSQLDNLLKIKQLQTVKDERTNAIKNYEYAQAGGYTGSFDEWEKDAKTVYQKDYERDVAEGYKGTFHNWLLTMKRAGAANINIGEQVEKKRALDQVAVETSVTSPKLVGEIEKELPSHKVYNANAEAIEADAKKYGITVEATIEMYRKAKVREKLDSMIRQAYKDKNVQWKKGQGWFVDGKLVRRDPYAAQ